ncbi:MAG: NAD(P)-binding domain-containing protein [Paracoccaceae bacterium]
MKYGYVGLGNLGGHLAASLIRAGHEVVVYDRDEALAERHRAMGATVAGSPAEVAAAADHVFTCLPSPAVCEAVLAQLLTAMKPGATWIENSTLGREDILRLAGLARTGGVQLLEAPVTGGVHLAARGGYGAGGRRCGPVRDAQARAGGDREPHFPHGAFGQRGGDQGDHQHAGLHPSGGGWRGLDAGQARRAGSEDGVAGDRGLVRIELRA